LADDPCGRVNIRSDIRDGIAVDESLRDLGHRVGDIGGGRPQLELPALLFLAQKVGDVPASSALHRASPHRQDAERKWGLVADEAPELGAHTMS
jgi:hypothetical protein